jgi:hypothetical protein
MQFRRGAMTSASDGSFPTAVFSDPALVLIVVHETGYAVRAATGFNKDRTLRLTKWARVTGRLEHPDTIVRLSTYNSYIETAPPIHFYDDTHPDANGEYVFNHALAGMNTLTRSAAMLTIPTAGNQGTIILSATLNLGRIELHPGQEMAIPRTGNVP